MASHVEWAKAYARQAHADFATFEILQPLPVPTCHKLQFLQMSCEKLVKAHLCLGQTHPATLQTSHAYVASTLPIVLRQQATFINFTGQKARSVLQQAKHLSQEIDLLAPAVKRGGLRPDNCEYPWENGGARLHVPVDWTFYPAQLLMERGGRTILKLIAGAIDRLLQ